VLGLVDREEGGREALAEASLTLETLFRRADFVGS
jgi:orotate phosphoribosyltransferase